MSLPTSFSNLSNATGQELDNNFSAVGLTGTIPCTVSGTNALSITPASGNVTISVYSQGLIVSGIATSSNTGSVTASIGSLAPLTIYKDSVAGPALLTGGEIVINNTVIIQYDAALNTGAGGFHLLTFPANAVTSPVLGETCNLKGSAAGSTKTASWTVTELAAVTVPGGGGIKGANLTLSFNGAGTGANGMDTGSVPTSASLSIYAIYSPATATWATLGQATASTVPTQYYSGANMPSGYIYSMLLWTGLTDGSANIIKFNQISRQVFVGPTQVVNSVAGGANTYATVSIAAAVPYGALTVAGVAGDTATTGNCQIAIASDTSGNYTQYVIGANAGVVLDTFGFSGNFNQIPLTTAQQLAWKAAATTVTNVIKVGLYTF